MEGLSRHPTWGDYPGVSEWPYLSPHSLYRGAAGEERAGAMLLALEMEERLEQTGNEAGSGDRRWPCWHRAVAPRDPQRL